MSASLARLERGVWVAACVLLLALVALCTALPVNFSAVDLGRHLKNGELFLQTLTPISTNFYAYTEPDFPAVNHHWLSGVVFYLVWKALGFTGLHAAYLALHVATVALFFFAARGADRRVTLLLAVLLLPVLCSRAEIRPEGLSYFALGVLTWWLLRPTAWRGVKVAVLSVLWVNAHIFFFLGWGLTGALLVHSALNRDGRVREWATLLAVQVAASLINPWGLAGLIEPFTILREYGYMVVENQSIPFVLKRLGDAVYGHYVGAGVGLAVLCLAALRHPARREWVGAMLLLTVFYALGFFAVRGMLMFALIALPFGGMIASRLLPARAREACLLAALVLMTLSLAVRGPYFSPWSRPHALGLMPGSQGAGEFLRRTGLSGPTFNNYDIGGYFIFHLFPQQRPFVDNRPEAYSVAFFKQTYEPMLRDEAAWRQAAARYGFNAIVFYRHDATEHAQPFLIRRIADPEWAPVFVDAYNIVLARRVDKNAAIIREHELPREMFSAVKN